MRITASGQTTIIASLQAWVLPHAFLKVANAQLTIQEFFTPHLG